MVLHCANSEQEGFLVLETISETFFKYLPVFKLKLSPELTWLLPHSLSLTLFSCLYFAGRFFASAAYDCVASQTACNNIGTFIDKLPQDSIVLIAIQESGATSSHRPPSSKLQKLGAQNITSVAENTSYVLIGYKGSKSVDWKQHLFKSNAAGPAEVSGLIPIQCSDLPSGKVQFNYLKKNYM